MALPPDDDFLASLQVTANAVLGRINRSDGPMYNLDAYERILREFAPDGDKLLEQLRQGPCHYDDRTLVHVTRALMHWATNQVHDMVEAGLRLRELACEVVHDTPNRTPRNPRLLVNPLTSPSNALALPVATAEVSAETRLALEEAAGTYNKRARQSESPPADVMQAPKRRRLESSQLQSLPQSRDIVMADNVSLFAPAADASNLSSGQAVDIEDRYFGQTPFGGFKAAEHGSEGIRSVYDDHRAIAMQQIPGQAPNRAETRLMNRRLRFLFGRVEVEPFRQLEEDSLIVFPYGACALGRGRKVSRMRVQTEHSLLQYRYVNNEIVVSRESEQIFRGEDDEVLPLYGGSDHEDYEVLESDLEDSDSERRASGAVRKSKQFLEENRVKEIVLEKLTAYRLNWDKRKLPLRQQKAWQVWAAGDRYARAAECKRDVQHYKTRLAKLQQELLGNQYKNGAEVVELCKGLQETVNAIKEREYELLILQQSNAPEKPSTVFSTRKVKAKTPDGDDDDEDLSSDSELDEAAAQHPPASAIHEHGDKEREMPTLLERMDIGSDSELYDAPMHDEPTRVTHEQQNNEPEMSMLPEQMETDDPITVEPDPTAPEPTLAPRDDEQAVSMADAIIISSDAPDHEQDEPVNDEHDADSAEEDESDGEVLGPQVLARRALRSHKRAAMDRLATALKAIERLSSDGNHQSDALINVTETNPRLSVLLHPYLAAEMKSHQIEGVRFMWREVVVGRTGGLLAHAMGLGKTLQAVAFVHTLCSVAKNPRLVHLLPERLQRSPIRTLIITLPGLVLNWSREIVKWLDIDMLFTTGEMVAINAEMALDKRIAALFRWKDEGGTLIIGYTLFANITADIGMGDVPLKGSSKTAKGKAIDKSSNRQGTNNPADADEVRKILLDEADLVIADEAHQFKNKGTKVGAAVGLFSTQSKIALTGTPLSNSVKEIFALINWCEKGYFGDAGIFNEVYGKPIEVGSWENAADSDRKRAATKLRALHRELAPKVSRMDASVLRQTLEPKTEFIISVNMTQLQSELYTAAVEYARAGVAPSIAQRNAVVWKWMWFLMLICDHPRALEARLNIKPVSKAGSGKVGGAKASAAKASTAKPSAAKKSAGNGARDSDGTEMSLDPALVKKLRNILLGKPRNLAAAQWSAKAMVLHRIVIHAKAVGDRVVVFSRSTFVLDHLEDFFRGKKFGVARLDGSTSTGSRPGMIEDFNSGTDAVLLVSTMAGGTGLNITGANRVVILDFAYNPQDEEQATGRCYRLGQKKPVFVYRFITNGTFEQPLFEMAKYKLQLAMRTVDKRSVQSKAYKMEHLLAELPHSLPQQDLSEHHGVDAAVLDKILNELGAETRWPKPQITKIETTDGLQELDVQALTALQEAEADEQFLSRLEEEDLKMDQRYESSEDTRRDLLSPKPDQSHIQDPPCLDAAQKTTEFEVQSPLTHQHSTARDEDAMEVEAVAQIPLSHQHSSPRHAGSSEAEPVVQNPLNHQQTSSGHAEASAAEPSTPPEIDLDSVVTLANEDARIHAPLVARELRDRDKRPRVPDGWPRHRKLRELRECFPAKSDALFLEALVYSGWDFQLAWCIMTRGSLRAYKKVHGVRRSHKYCTLGQY